MMTYKALNTFIDDLFAFVIKMPTMYRLGCFRDGKSNKTCSVIFKRALLLDIIFFIYLYQRYIYPVDRTRLNEFGTTGETDSALVPVDEQQSTNDMPTEQTTSINSTTDEHEKTE